MLEAPKRFSFAELTRTAAKLSNTPESWDQVSNLLYLGKFLDKIRAEFGKAIKVNSAYRSKEVNAAAGGVANSAHRSGLAADICALSGTESDNRILLHICESHLPAIDQLISYHRTAGDKSAAIRFIHVGLPVEGTVGRSQRLYK